VEGAESELKDIHEAVTEPVDTEGARESFTLMAPLNYRGKNTTLKAPGAVEVKVAIEPVEPPAEEEKGRNNQ
jgi:hypothetical protein